MKEQLHTKHRNFECLPRQPTYTAQATKDELKEIIIIIIEWRKRGRERREKNAYKRKYAAI